MQLEEAYAVEITKLVECVDSKEDALMQIGRMLQHINSALLQSARRLKTEVQIGKRQIKDSIAEKIKKDDEGRECIENFHVR